MGTPSLCEVEDGDEEREHGDDDADRPGDERPPLGVQLAAHAVERRGLLCLGDLALVLGAAGLHGAGSLVGHGGDALADLAHPGEQVEVTELRVLEAGVCEPQRPGVLAHGAQRGVVKTLEQLGVDLERDLDLDPT